MFGQYKQVISVNYKAHEWEIEWKIQSLVLTALGHTGVEGAGAEVHKFP